MTCRAAIARDALDVFDLPIHVFGRVAGEPPTPSACERCGGTWDTLDDALAVPCRKVA